MAVQVNAIKSTEAIYCLQSSAYFEAHYGGSMGYMGNSKKPTSRVSDVAPTEEDVSMTLADKIMSFINLKDNWDGYGARRVSKRAVYYAGNLLKRISAVPKSVWPRTGGAVELEFSTPKGQAFLMVKGSGRVRLVTVSSGRPSTSKEYSVKDFSVINSDLESVVYGD